MTWRGCRCSCHPHAEGKWREVGYYCARCGHRREADVIPMKEKP